MHNETYNLIRFVMIILAILTFVVLCLTDESRNYPQHHDFAPAETQHPKIQSEYPNGGTKEGTL